MNRVRIHGKIKYTYDQIIQLTGHQLKELRNSINNAKIGKQSVDDFLGKTFGDTTPINCEYTGWKAELIEEIL